MKRSMFILIITTLTLLTGCLEQSNNSFKLNPIESDSPKIEQVILDRDEDMQLTIGYFSEDQFRSRYGDLLTQSYPRLRINILPTADFYKQKVTLEQWMEENQPDLMYIPGHLMGEAVQTGLFQSLDATINKEKFDLSQYVPEVIDLTRKYGQGELYGLPPTFDGRAIVYNQTLFDKLKIEYPKDAMSWQEIITLAERIAVSSIDSGSVYGLVTQHRNPYDYIRSIGSTNDLRSYNSTTKQVTFNSDSWMEVWEMGIQSLNNGAVHIENLNNLADLFISEQTAMLMVTYDQFNRFNRVQMPFDWAAVSAPVNENRRAQSDGFFIDGFYVIPAASTKKEAAWELLKFFNSETVARWEMQGVYGFPSNQTVLYVESNEKRNIRAFTSFEPILSTDGMPSGLVELGGQIYSEVLPDLSNLSAVLDKLQSEAEKYVENSK